MSDSSSLPWLRKIPFYGNRLADRLDGAPIVPVLRLSGVIGGSASIRKGGLSLADMAGSIEKAFEHSGAVAVALAINSPGGSPVQSSLIAKRIRDLAGEKELPVFAFCEDVAASGGYWLACAADEIHANPSSIVGSIGVVSAGFGFPALLEKVGIERRVHTAGENKAILDPFARKTRTTSSTSKSSKQKFMNSSKRMCAPIAGKGSTTMRSRCSVAPFGLVNVRCHWVWSMVWGICAR